jgi:hypothetical protein
MATRGILPGDKVGGARANLAPPSSAVEKNTWSFAFTPIFIRLRGVVVRKRDYYYYYYYYYYK